MPKRLNHLFPPKCDICGGSLPTDLHTVYCADPECVAESYRRRQRRYYWRKRYDTAPPNSPEAPLRFCLVCRRALPAWSHSRRKTCLGFCQRVRKADRARATYYRRQARQAVSGPSALGGRVEVLS